MPLLIDKTRIQQILYNLLSNAIKFSKAGDTITVLIKLIAGSVGGLNEFEISVTDQGMGLNEADREGLFKPFFQSSNEENRQANPKSNGLGLSICRQIALNLNGNLELCPRYRSGCRFKFSFKAQRKD